METRTFSTDAVLSLTTGILLCRFGDMHEVAEWVAGHPIWTHEFASRPLHTRLRLLIGEQHPELLEGDRPTSDNWQEWRDGRIAKHGDTIELRRGADTRTENPMESAKRLAPNADVVAVTPAPLGPIRRRR